LAGRHPGERVIVVSHGGLLSAILRHFLGVPMERVYGFRLANGSISVVAQQEGRWLVETLGDTCHLEQKEK
jgi:broad specificity phosphatase PhoE